jgi:nucleotide-binding universal stress UspA family protein
MFKTILASLKFNATGQEVLSFAARLAKDQGAALHVLHTLDYHLVERGEDDLELVAACRSAEDHFAQMYGQLSERPAEMRFHCMAGVPAMAACRLARDLPADLLLLGCHQGDRCLSRVDYTGMTVLDKAPCPVLVVPLNA